jgi:glutamate synthase (NADPH/NADH) small chain
MAESVDKKPVVDRLHAVKMAKQNPKERIHNFEEVELGYSEGQAGLEAQRCLLCAKPQCSKGCPAGIDIPAFIKLIREKKYAESIAKIKEKNCLPAVCGRVCPQEEQCQKLCILGKKGNPVEIGRLERFIADVELREGLNKPNRAEPTGKQVAVVGAGPAGLTVAADLVQLGHRVVIFEALHKAGGVLVYGIPEFRLPKRIVKAEVEYVKSLGAELRTDVIVGRLFSIQELFTMGFDAIFIGTGAGLPKLLGIPGENLCGVFSANEFLIRVNLMKAYKFPSFDTPITAGKRVAVIGGGNVAIDAARSALRMNAEEVFLVYRRSKEELPARHEELVNAEEEGIIFKFLSNPKRFLGDEQGWVRGIELSSMELSEPDASGRRRAVPVEGSESVLEVDTVIVAIGRTPNPIIQSMPTGLQINKQGNIAADEDTGKTSLEGVYAGGDIVTSEATVIKAIEAGKRSARAIHEYIMSKKSK